jgi:glycosyltransferase involved in cell wall biosynthesis
MRFSLIVPFYRNVQMLRHQISAWEDYPKEIQIILVDDGSPEPASEILLTHATPELLERVSLYRIGVDIPWNRGGARNLGTKEATTDWVVHVDIDHLLPAEFARLMLEQKPDPRRWYRFERFRVGKADETRRKDKIGDDVEFGKIHPHIDSYLCTRDLYWKAGGYNEDFSGCLGGGSPFLAELERVGGKPLMVPAAHLLVYTRSVASDASDHTLSRERGEFSRRKATMRGKYRGHNPIRFPWTKCTLA